MLVHFAVGVILLVALWRDSLALGALFAIVFLLGEGVVALRRAARAVTAAPDRSEHVPASDGPAGGLFARRRP